MKKAILSSALAASVGAHDILQDCGAIPTLGSDVSLEQTQQNSKALYDCFDKAQNDPVDRTVVVPRGHIFVSMPVNLNNMKDVTLTIDGVLETSPYWQDWPLYPSSSNGKSGVVPFIMFTDSENININGEGTVEGQGYDWWVREFKNENKHSRPDLLYYSRVQTSEISGVSWRNGPKFHLHLMDVDSIYIHDMEIEVDILKQQEIRTKPRFQNVATSAAPDVFDVLLSESWDDLIENLMGSQTVLSMPTMPLNTDGIDPSGSNVTIRNVNITNFDDAVAVKPSNKDYKIAKDGCSQDMLIENVNVKFGVGMTIGSVPPKKTHNCVKNITFRNINFEYPLKALYIKSNPNHGDVGESAEITNVLYENIKIHFPVWWNIYIGPQQMKEPDGRGPGCMTYPFGDCATEPLVSINNITIRNLESHGGFLPPGVIRCNETNTCENFNFENIEIHGWWESMGWGFITEFAHGTSNNVYPDPGFGTRETEQVFELFSIKNILKGGMQLTNFYKTNENDITAWEVLLGFVIWAVDLVI